MEPKEMDGVGKLQEGSLPYEKRKVKSFKDLIVWEKSYALTLDIYKTTKQFPKDEQYHLTDQLRRAASSIPINIAEGMGRQTRKEFIRYLIVARGSCEELKCLLLLAKDLNYINEELYRKLNPSMQEIGKMLNGLIRAIRG